MNGTTFPAIVGVVRSRSDLRRAAALEILPDFFELRLDSLAKKIVETDDVLGKLRAPIIITARHPAEGGIVRLRARERRSLLLRFLPRAAYVDVELRSARALAGVLEEAGARKVGTIISFHDFKATPDVTQLEDLADAACALGADFLKLSTRTDQIAELARLHDFFLRHGGGKKIAVMGIGRLGRRLRMEMAAMGSALNYAHLGTPNVEGQLSITELRRILKKKFRC